MGFPSGSAVKNLPTNAGDTGDQIPSLSQGDLLEEDVATHSSILAWKFHGQCGPAGYSPWGHKESDMTELLSTHICLMTPRNKRFFYGHRTISGLVCLDVKESSFLALEVTIITVTVKFLSSFVAQSLAFNRKFILNGHR